MKKKVTTLLVGLMTCILSSSLIANAATHVHGDNCYENTAIKHIHEGVNTKAEGCYKNGYVIGMTRCPGKLQYNYKGLGTTRCGACGTSLYVYEHRCSNYAVCKYTASSPKEKHECGGIVRNYEPYVEHPSCKVNMPEYSLTCGKEEGFYDSDGTAAQPICNKKISSIAPKSSSQTVVK